MDEDAPGELLARLGSVATRTQLLVGLGRRAAEALIEQGGVDRVARGRYAAATAGEAARAAARLSGTLCLLDAAIQHGWPVRLAPTRPQVCVPRSRRLAPGAARGVDLRRFDLGPDDRRGRVTSPERTLVDCARHLPLVDSLPVLDSALRDGFSPTRLARGTRVATTAWWSAAGWCCGSPGRTSCSTPTTSSRCCGWPSKNVRTAPS